MKEYESTLKEQLLLKGDKQFWNELMIKHTRLIQYMQHERLIHLLVTLAFGFFLLITMTIAFIKPVLQVIILIGLFFILLFPYVMHYFFLENTIQAWYRLSDEIEKKQMTFK